jgi:hypothetical protein
MATSWAACRWCCSTHRWGTYLCWNITAGGARPFHHGQICNYVGGMVPFARSAAERKATGDPCPSLEERYGSHEGYVAGVRKAADRALRAGFLLQPDAESLIRQAEASKVLAERPIQSIQQRGLRRGDGLLPDGGYLSRDASVSRNSFFSGVSFR